MTKLKPTDLAPKWDGDDMLHRMSSCASILHVHGFLSDGERRKVQARLEKWVDFRIALAARRSVEVRIALAARRVVKTVEKRKRVRRRVENRG